MDTAGVREGGREEEGKMEGAKEVSRATRLVRRHPTATETVRNNPTEDEAGKAGQLNGSSFRWNRGTVAQPLRPTDQETCAGS